MSKRKWAHHGLKELHFRFDKARVRNLAYSVVKGVTKANIQGDHSEELVVGLKDRNISPELTALSHELLPLNFNAPSYDCRSSDHGAIAGRSSLSMPVGLVYSQVFHPA